MNIAAAAATVPLAKMISCNAENLNYVHLNENDNYKSTCLHEYRAEGTSEADSHTATDIELGDEEKMHEISDIVRKHTIGKGMRHTIKRTKIQCLIELFICKLAAV